VEITDPGWTTFSDIKNIEGAPFWGAPEEFPWTICYYPPSGPRPFAMIINNAGVNNTMQSDGKINSAIGTNILIGAL
jgi:hypothetical protein